jgi:hypothetical protein
MATQLIPVVEGARVGPSQRSSFCVGDVSLALNGDSANEVRLDKELNPFLRDGGNAEIEVSVEWVDRLHPFQGVPDFDSGAVWKLSRHGKEFIFDFCNTNVSPNPYKRLITEHDFRSAQLVLSRDLHRRLPAVFPLEYPADELLFTNYFGCDGSGVEVHGCGLIDSEMGGQLFLGHSGAGKSTTSRLWKSFRNPEILSDDRLILRLQDGELWMYGTPWHGDAGFASCAKAKLERIFILQHGSDNKLVPLSSARGAGELFARSFPPFHSAEALERTVEFINRVVEAVPCFEFHFVPDAQAVEAILRFRGLQ